MRFIRPTALIIALGLGLCPPAAHAADRPAVAGKKSLGALTLASPCPVWVIGTYDKAGKPNVMTASWTGICCSRPPCITVSIRRQAYTHGNIMENKAFTVSIPSEAFTREAAYFGTASGKDVDKFKETGLTPVRGDSVNAPYVGEFPLVIECKLVKTIELGSHTMFIGEIKDVKADESILNDRGQPDELKLRPFVFAPGNPNFYSIGSSLGRYEDLIKGMVPPKNQ
jgi:flavin reductase (DIM6/NTAB) family NADH-FMN oxidoreductase RutF